MPIIFESYKEAGSGGMYPGFTHWIRDKIPGYKMPIILGSYKETGPVLEASSA
jgi:hypothetical protein